MSVPNSQTTAHWSKDFVEHLRTVHFALIAVAAGLIILVLSSRTYNSISALVEIEQIIKLRSDWSPAWFAEYGLTQNPYVPLNGEATRPALIDTFLDEDITKAKQGFVGQIFWRPLDSNTQARLIIHCLLPKDNWYRESNTTPEWSPTQFPQTVADFAEWWETLKTTPFVLYTPVTIEQKSSVYSTPTRIEGQFVVGSLGSNAKTPITNAILSLTSSSDDDQAEAETYAFEHDEFYYHVPLESREYSLMIPITQLSVHQVTQDSVNREFHSIKPGHFEESFYDLSTAVKGAMAELELETVKGLIHDEASKGPEVFEVFGMKFPAGQVTVWGEILVLGIQLYLLIYLKQLTGNLRDSDPGWDVPWIGMDSSRLSRILFFLSLVVLPCLALIVLGSQASARISTGYWFPTKNWFRLREQIWMWNSFVLARILCLICAAVGSGYLGVLSWRYRPQIAPEPPNPPSCPAQRFE